MKTTDLIPLILYQLVDDDKYGYEIVKQIEDSSSGKIVIKQPTLYSLLKKLEQGKFISSYWQDSEIGGKRHYYKLTDSGRAQLDTYPSFEQLIKDAIGEDFVIDQNIATLSPTADIIVPTDSVDKDVDATNNIVAPIDVASVSAVDAEPMNVATDNGVESVDISTDNSVEINTEIKDSIISNTEFNDIEVKPIHIDLTIPSTMQSNDNEIARPALSETETTFNKAEDLNFEQRINETETKHTSPYENNTSVKFNIFDGLETNSLNNDLSTLNSEPAFSNSVASVSVEAENSIDISTGLQKTSELDYKLAKVDEKDSKSVNDGPLKFNIFDAIAPAGDSAQTLETQPTPPPQEFVKKVETVEPASENNKLYDKLSPNNELASAVVGAVDEVVEAEPIDQVEQVKYLQYVDLTTDSNAIKRKKSITRHILKMSLTCISLLMVFVLSLVLASKYSFSKIYYVFAIIVSIVVVLYPILLLKNKSKMRLKYCSCPFVYSVARDFFIKLSLFLTLLIAIFAYNLSIVNSIKEIFMMDNFANFLAPTMFSAVIMLDFVYSLLLYKKYTK